MIKRYLLIIGIVTLTNIYSFSQAITNSPYTRFGIGDIDRNGFNNSKAMGGLSTGLRANNQINYMNPAALSAQDTMSFILDLGVKGVFKDMQSSTTSANFKDFTFDHLAMSFPIKRWWFASFGITPYSKIGYDIQQIGDYPLIDTINIHYNYYGNGGINQLFISNSFLLFNKLSIGFNINYLFGSIEQYNQAYLDREDSYGIVVADEISLKKLTYDFGMQYSGELSEEIFYVLGLTYSNQIKFNSTKNTTVLMTENYSLYNINIIDYLASNSKNVDTIASSVTNNYKVDVPARYSIGFTTGIKNKLTLGFDYSYQDWENIKSLNVNDNFGTDQSFNFGFEYIPNKFSLRDYYKKINYRAGAYLNSTYLKLNDKQINNYGITFGLGFPLTNQRTSLNLSYSYGKRGTTTNGLIEENYHTFGINITLYDFWFIKRKFQ